MPEAVQKDPDEVLYLVGQFGLYQRLLFLTMGLTAVGVSFHNLLQVFTGAVPIHMCNYNRTMYTYISQGNNIYKYKDVNVTMWDERSVEDKYWLAKRCELYDNRLSNTSSHERPEKKGINTGAIKCTSWDFDTSQYHTSIATEVRIKMMYFHHYHHTKLSNDLKLCW